MAAVLALAVGGSAPGVADEPVPSSCKAHPRHVVNPGCAPALTGDLMEPGITLPNLVPNVEEVHVVGPPVFDEATQTFVLGEPRELLFDSHAQNLGTVPMQLTVTDVEDPPTTTAAQCVSWTPDHVCREQQDVGTFVWHTEHAHFHFEDFADYELRRFGPDRRPDYSEAGLIARSEKVSFCLMDTKPVQGDDSSVPFYATCTPTLQGVSPGWTDIYSPDLPGQSLPLEGLSDGRYALVVSLDPTNRLLETDDTDNVVEITLELSHGVTQVSIVDRQYP